MVTTSCGRRPPTRWVAQLGEPVGAALRQAALIGRHHRRQGFDGGQHRVEGGGVEHTA
jgi:hypothetical protein